MLGEEKRKKMKAERLALIRDRYERLVNERLAKKKLVECGALSMPLLAGESESKSSLESNVIDGTFVGGAKGVMYKHRHY